MIGLVAVGCGEEPVIWISKIGLLYARSMLDRLVFKCTELKHEFRLEKMRHFLAPLSSLPHQAHTAFEAIR